MTRATMLLAAACAAGSAPPPPATAAPDAPAADPAPGGTKADYERAAALRRTTADKVFRDKVRPQWLPGNNAFWYRVRTGPDTQEYVYVDAVQGVRRPAFDHARLAEALRRSGVADARADRLVLEGLALDAAASQADFRCGGRTWRCSLPACELRERTVAEPPAPAGPTADPPKASTRTGDETSVTVLNKTAAEVELLWLDAGGERHGYGKIPPGGRHAQHTFAGHVWWVVDAKGALLAAFEATEQPSTIEVEPRREGDAPIPPRATPRPPTPRTAGVSPDGAWRAFIQDGNVWIQDLKSGTQAALSTDGTAEDAYGGEPLWSPDASRLVVLRTRRGGDRKVTVVESSPKDQLQPKVHTYRYLKPGDPIPTPKPHLFDVAARKEIPVRDDLFPTPWDLYDLRWDPDGTRFTFVYNQRGHQVLRLIAVDARTGEARTLIDESVKTFFDYEHKRLFHPLDTAREILWMSERSGWNHLYLHDAATGAVKNAVTSGAWVVRGVDRVDEQTRQVWFRAMGIRKGQDPYYVHYARVHLDGTGLVVLTEGDGTHTVEWSPDRRFLVDTWSRVDQPPVTELRRASDGSLVCVLERADASALLATGWRPPEPFAAKGRDGTTDIHGILIRPSTFDPARRYPVLEDIYAGPHGFHVPKAFGLQLRQRGLAELGFIVAMIDGMGTNWRSKAFHDVCWKHLADAGFPDRIAWMKAAAERHPEMDLARVGLFGGSAGGQNALGALLLHGDFYKAAAADCGCHDNRMDKIWWNELWMGWPVGPHYEAQSNATLARHLRGKLLLTVGELDDNVDPASTMQVVNALIQADKDFEMLVIPGARHGAGETPYAQRRRQDFFVRHLLGVEPRSR